MDRRGAPARRIGIVAFIPGAAIATNVTVNLKFNHLSEHFPFIGVAVLVTAPLRKPEWSLLPGATLGTIFLLALVTMASMMPVEELPPPPP